MNRCLRVAVGAVLLSLPLGCKSQDKPAEPLTYEQSFRASVSAKVKAVDVPTRVITLRDESGHEETFVVDRAVRRLDEVRVGDTVRADYQANLRGELRAPTADEAAHPLVITAAAGRTAPGQAPAAGVGREVRAVTKVEAVDVPNMRVTLRGPLGDLAVVRGKKKENLERLHIGDTIVITYTDAAVVSLEK